MKKFIVGIPYTGCEYTSEIPCTSEAEAVAVACGAWLGGREDCLVFMQDAGFLSALNCILGLQITYEIDISIATKNTTTPMHHFMTGMVWYNIMGKINATTKLYQGNNKRLN